MTSGTTSASFLTHSGHRIGAAAAVFLFTTAIKAQCQAYWAAEGAFGLDDTVATSVLWDPDGSGPLGPRLVVAGPFTQVAGAAIPAIAAFDLVSGTWSPLGAPGPITALCATLQGGLFAAVGNSVVHWNGTSWQGAGQSTNGAVNALTALPNGDVVACGTFTSVGAMPAGGFARWNGTTWQTTGLGVPAVGRTMFTQSNGQVLAAGSFTVGGIAAEYVARWDGTFWTTLGPSFHGIVRALTSMPNGDVVAAGDFTSIGATAASRLARWDGSSWQPYGSGADGSVRALAATPYGHLVVGGDFTALDGLGLQHIALWTGSQWYAFGSGMDAPVKTLQVLPNGDITAGGDFGHADRVHVRHLARWSGSVWSSLPQTTPFPATPGEVKCVLRMANDDLLVGGDFVLTGGGNNIARWSSGRWETLDYGLYGVVRCLIDTPQGIVAGGDFVAAHGGSVHHVARWTGSSWVGLGGGLAASVGFLCLLPNGDVAAIQDASALLSIWNGTTWTTQPLPGVPYLMGPPSGAVVLSTGALAVSFRGSNFAPGTVQTWDGTTWTVRANDSTYCLAALPDGQFAYGGPFGVKVWSGTQSSNLPGLASVGVLDTSTGVILAVSTSGGCRVAQWNGISWQPLTTNVGGSVACVAGTVSHTYIAGSLSSVNSIAPVGNLACYQHDCPATATTTGPGCASSGGTLRTTVEPLPWLGNTCISRTTGLAGNAFAFVVYGFSNPNLTLASLHPLGGSGCRLLAEDDIVFLQLPLLGEVTSSLVVPNDPSFAGIVLYHQVLQFEFDQSFQVTAIGSGNGLRLQLATF